MTRTMSRSRNRSHRSDNEKKVKYTRREEKKGNEVVITIGIVAVVLAVLMIALFS